MGQVSVFTLIMVGFIIFCIFLIIGLRKANKEDALGSATGDYAKMLHSTGIVCTDGRVIRRSEGKTFQLTEAETEMFFSVMAPVVREIVNPSGTYKDKRVLYLGRRPSELRPNCDGTLFMVVYLNGDKPILDLTPFSATIECVSDIAKKYDTLTRIEGA